MVEEERIALKSTHRKNRRNMKDKKTYTTKQIAKYLRMAPASFRRLRKKDYTDIPVADHYTWAGNEHNLYNKDQVLQYLLEKFNK